jgi:hypothetical protein
MAAHGWDMQDAEQRADGQLAAILKPRVKRAPPPRVQADLPAFAALAVVCRLWRILHKRHYVDGWVMWPPVVFPLLMRVLGLVAAT